MSAFTSVKTRVTKTVNVSADTVKPRDMLVYKWYRVTWVNHTEEFHVTIGTTVGHVVRLPKVSVVTVVRESQS